MSLFAFKPKSTSVSLHIHSERKIASSHAFAQPEIKFRKLLVYASENGAHRQIEYQLFVSSKISTSGQFLDPGVHRKQQKSANLFSIRINGDDDDDDDDLPFSEIAKSR